METDTARAFGEERFAHIKGWGIDANPRNDPTFPIRNRNRDTHGGMDWERPVQQQAGVEVLCSIERPGLPAVFGTSLPPKGVSGALRRLAFKYSESDYRHWLPLLLADRLEIYRGYAEDLKNGHIPNLLKERGFKADWEYNRKKTVGKIALVTGAAFVALVILKSKSKKKR